MTTTISHSPSADALYIRLEDTPIARTEEVAGGHVMVDRSPEGHIVGIEILLPLNESVTFTRESA